MRHAPEGLRRIGGHGSNDGDGPCTSGSLPRGKPPASTSSAVSNSQPSSRPNRTFSVVANLPFARSSAILNHLLRSPLTQLQRAHVIVQWEFAAKHAAVWPATLRATYWRAWYDVSISRRLASTAFSPPPRVAAAVLHIERRERPRVPSQRHHAYWGFLSAAFSSGQPIRRSLGPRLSPLEVKRLATVLGFSPDARPRDVDATQWSALFEHADRQP